jgi:beta-lactam-binding protein with PASTA domain
MMHRFCAAGLMSLLLLLTAGTLWADENDKRDLQGAKVQRMPSLVGMQAEAGLRRLEEMGVEFEVITIAVKTPGQITATEPEFNAVLEPDAFVTVWVSVPRFIMTTVPEVRGMAIGSVYDALETAYALDIKEVDGPADQAGRIVSQSPSAGATHPMRGHFILQVIRERLVVPQLVGLGVAQARALAEESGLLVDVQIVPATAGRTPGAVVAQQPQAGAEAQPGSFITLEVASGQDPQADPNVANHIRVPSLVGLTLHGAQSTLLTMGLVPHIEFADAANQRAMTVISQVERRGTLVAPGSHVHFTVALGAAPTETVAVPTFVGTALADARALAQQLGLQVVVQRVQSRLSPDLVIRQAPEDGTQVAQGAQVTLTVTEAPPPSWQDQFVSVPDFSGRGLHYARRVALASGLGLRIVHADAPDQPLNEVVSQQPAAGARVASGTQVTLHIPARAVVPDLVGQSVRRAQDLLGLAGLRGVQVGGSMAGAYVVRDQSIEPGAEIARGSTVRYRVEIRGGQPPLPVPGAQFVRIPDLRGMGLSEGARQLQDLGLRVVQRGAQVGIGEAVITEHSPSAGQAVARGSTVVVTYEWQPVNAPPTGLVVVPDLRGEDAVQAQQILRGMGLGFRLAGINRAGATVLTLSPGPGTRVRAGTLITMTLGVTARPGPGVGLSIVPDVRGRSRAAATSQLESAGFRVLVRGTEIRIGNRRSTVRSMSPAPGVRATRGSVITITLGL